MPRCLVLAFPPQEQLQLVSDLNLITTTIARHVYLVSKPIYTYSVLVILIPISVLILFPMLSLAIALFGLVADLVLDAHNFDIFSVPESTSVSLCYLQPHYFPVVDDVEPLVLMLTLLPETRAINTHLWSNGALTMSTLTPSITEWAVIGI